MKQGIDFQFISELKGRSNRRLISMDEVRKHKTDGSVWTVLKGRVYNITPYLNFHPGGIYNLPQYLFNCSLLCTYTGVCIS